MSDVNFNNSTEKAVVAFGSITNFYYVDKSGNDTSGDGSQYNPYLTISKALNVIGTASSVADFNDATKYSYHVSVGPGIYTENPTAGTRPVISLDLTHAKIVGNFTRNFDQTVATGTLQQPKMLIYGQDLRSTYNSSAIPWTGINGNIIDQSTTGGSSLVNSFHLLNTGCTGNFTHQRDGVSGGSFTSQLFLENAIVSGTISTGATSGSVTLYAANVDTSGSFAIGGVNGFVILNILRNVRFDGVVVTSSGGARWFNVAFAAVANDFTGSSGTIVADNNSISSFNANVPTKGSVVFSAADVCVGTTAQRPPGNITHGYTYFDTTVNKPIWADGAGGWVDATGTAV